MSRSLTSSATRSPAHTPHNTSCARVSLAALTVLGQHLGKGPEQDRPTLPEGCHSCDRSLSLSLLWSQTQQPAKQNQSSHSKAANLETWHLHIPLASAAGSGTGGSKPSTAKAKAKAKPAAQLELALEHRHRQPRPTAAPLPVRLLQKTFKTVMVTSTLHIIKAQGPRGRATRCPATFAVLHTSDDPASPCPLTRPQHAVGL